MEDQPGLHFREVESILGQRWKAITEEERQQYDEMAAKDSIRHQKEMEEYNQLLKAAAAGEEGNSGPVQGESVYKRKKKDPNLPKQKLSAYNFFASETRKKSKTC